MPINSIPSVQIRSRALSGFDALVGSHGGDAGALMQKAGLPIDILNHPDDTIALDKLVELLEITSHALAMDDIGLQLAKLQDISVLGPVALTARHAGTVAEALDAVARHLPYHTPGAQLTVQPDVREGYMLLRYDLALADDVSKRHIVELSYAVAASFLRMLSPTGTENWLIRFRHRKGLSGARYQRFFGCKVLLGQPLDGLSIPCSLLQVPIDGNNPELGRVAERFVANIVRRYPLNIVAQVEALIIRQLATGQCTLPRIAQQLALHERTVQRRLSEKGVFFEDVIDRVRRARAEEYLPHMAIPLQQVASLLGYSEQSSFNRACRRWFGSSPSQVRTTICG